MITTKVMTMLNFVITRRTLVMAIPLMILTLMKERNKTKMNRNVTKMNKNVMKMNRNVT